VHDGMMYGWNITNCLWRSKKKVLKEEDNHVHIEKVKNDHDVDDVDARHVCPKMFEKYMIQG